MVKATVAAIIINEYDPRKILLTRRKVSPFTEKWCLPGGHIDKYESAERAIIREVKEETSIEYSPKFMNYFDEIIQYKNIHSVVIVFEGSCHETPTPDNNEVGEIAWRPIYEAQKEKLAFRHNEILEYYIKQHFPCK